MCLAIPGKIKKINGQNAVIDYEGLEKNANISLVDVQVNDYVIVHAGFAIEKLTKDDAQETLSYFKSNE
jgi:hydrogenase expression/formation protein HypC